MIGRVLGSRDAGFVANVAGRATIVRCRQGLDCADAGRGGGCAGAQGGRRRDRRKDLNLSAARQGGDRCLLVIHEQVQRDQHADRQNCGDGNEPAFAVLNQFGRRAWVAAFGLKAFQFETVLFFHLVRGQFAAEHGFAKRFNVDAVKMPDDDGKRGEQCFAAVRGFSGGDQIAGHKPRGVDRVPHHKPGQAHNDCAPHERPVFRFFGKVKAIHFGMFARETQVVANHVNSVE